MGFLGLKRKPREEKTEEPVHKPVAPLPSVLNVLVPDIAGSTSFHLRQFYDIDEARAYIQALPSTSGLHAFWGLHAPPDGHVTGEGPGESMVLIRSAEDSDTVYVVSFVDLDSANAFARFEAKRGMSLGLLLIYWAEIVDIVVDDLSVTITPEVAPRAGRRTVPAAPQPEPVAARPVQAPQPEPAAAAPVVETEPVVETPEPEPAAEAEPVVQEPEPEPTAVEPAVQAPDPKPVAAEPVAESPGPEPVAAEPAIEAPQTEPVVETRPLFGTKAPEPVARDEPEPVAAIEPEPLPPEPTPTVHPGPETRISEPAPIAEDEGFSAHVEREPVAETAPPAEEREPQFNAEPDVTTTVPEPIAEATPPPPSPGPEPEVIGGPVAQLTPETVPDTPEIEPDLVQYAPEPVAEPAAELAESKPDPAVPEPEYAEVQEPEPVVDESSAQPQPQADAPKHFEVRLKMPGSEPETPFEEKVAPESEPEPVSLEEPEPLETPPPLFRASYAGGATEEEIDIEREAVAFLKASANGKKSALEDEPEEAASPDAVHVEPPDVVEEAAYVNGAWTETAGAATPADDTGQAPAEQEPPVDGQASEDLVQEVEKILKVKRWNKKDSPFRGFDSPPGRF